MRLDPKLVRDFYMQDWVIDALFDFSKNREIAPVYYSTKYGKRPDMIQYRDDITALVKQGTTSFHCSVERWENPLQLDNKLSRDELDKNRIGWDLILDVDSKKGLKVAQITAKLLVEALQVHGIKNISVKFSGRRGFHIGVPFESLPKVVDYTPVQLQYPELMQKIAQYLREFIKEKLAKELLAFDEKLALEMKETASGATLTERNQKIKAQISQHTNLNPYKVVEVEQNWSVRHLFRMPYSFNEKTGLISLPIDPNKIDKFVPNDAAPHKVKNSSIGFFKTSKENEAMDLVMETLDFHARKSIGKELDEAQKAMKKNKDYSTPTTAIPETMFPPSIKNILDGLKDGRKRSVFILINFLGNCGWNFSEIETRLKEWNSKNPEQLEWNYIATQLNYAKKRKKFILPPNYENKGYYYDIGVLKEGDEESQKYKNPVTYATRRYWASVKGAKSARKAYAKTTVKKKKVFKNASPE